MRILWFTSRTEEAACGRTLADVPGWAVEHVEDALTGLGRLRASSYDVIVADLPLPDWAPEEWLEEVQRINGRVPVVFRQECPTHEDALRLAKLGAYHLFGLTEDRDKQTLILEEAAQYRRQQETALLGGGAGSEAWKKFLLGESRAMRDIDHVIRLIAARRCTVLITGETGTGKEMLARAIHLASPRAHLPLVAVNCHALPESLLEAELFGHVRGAFTGAIGQRIGRFEQAHHSTLFLDEIGDMPLQTQAKLLRVLQEREIQRLGSSESIALDVRVIAATNQDLGEKVAAGSFREDLYYRLNVVPVRMPPLRERRSDIPLLVHHFLEKVCLREDLPPCRIARETLERLSEYSWPGNVRQLENAVEMAVLMAGERRILYPGDFPLPAARRRESAAVTPGGYAVPDEGLDFERIMNGIERTILEQALQRTRGNKKQAAELLHLKRTTLSAKLKSLQMAGA